MPTDHEELLEHLCAASDMLRERTASRWPLLDQLIQLAMQALIAYLTGLLKPPTPTEPPAE